MLDGSGTVEATSVGFDRDDTPTIGIVSVLLADGRRVLANCLDPDALRAMCDDAWEGRTVRFRGENGTNGVVTD